MRPFHEYPQLTVDQLQVEISGVVKSLYESYGEYAKARADYERNHLTAYYNSDDTTYAGRTRYADSQTYTEHDDVVTFEQNIAAFKVLYEYLTNLINWKEER